jgi:hypothetical protein
VTFQGSGTVLGTNAFPPFNATTPIPTTPSIGTYTRAPDGDVWTFASSYPVYLGTQGYATLEAAIAAAGLGGQIRIMSDITVNAPIYLAESRSLRLEGGDLTLTNSASLTGAIWSHIYVDSGRILTVGSGGLMIENNGNLTNNGTIRLNDGSAILGRFIVLTGTLEVVSGATATLREIGIGSALVTGGFGSVLGIRTDTINSPVGAGNNFYYSDGTTPIPSGTAVASVAGSPTLFDWITDRWVAQALAAPGDITNDFTDPNFLAAVRSLTSVPDTGPIYAFHVSGITILNVQNRGIISLAGIEHFTSIIQLICRNNLLTTLDLSQNPTLQVLDAELNQITSLNVTENPALIQLSCFSNSLTALDLSGNPLLESLACFDNLLTELNVTTNPLLQMIHCHENNMTTPDDVIGWQSLNATVVWGSNMTNMFRFFPQNAPGTQNNPFQITNATELGYVGRGTDNPAGFTGWAGRLTRIIG